MATFNLRRFANPETLRTIDERHLRALLGPHASYLSSRGVHLEPERPLDHDALASVLLAPDDATPESLVSALYLVHETSTPGHMAALLEALPAGLLDAAPDATPADVAIQAWLRAPEVLERVHARRFAKVRRSFTHHLAAGGGGDLGVPEPEKLVALERDLGEWFALKKKGEQARVFAYAKNDGVWFVIRHGGSFRRERAVRAGKSATVFFRPERHDVVVHNAVAGELRVNAGTKAEKEIYRVLFGTHLFGDPEHFPLSKPKYTLEPLARDPEASLVCADVAGLVSVTGTRDRLLLGRPGEGIRDSAVRRSRRCPSAAPSEADPAGTHGSRDLRGQVLRVGASPARSDRAPEHRSLHPRRRGTADRGVACEARLLPSTGCRMSSGTITSAEALWNAICQTPELSGVLADWETIVGGDPAVLRPFLATCKELVSAYPCPFTQSAGCTRRVVSRKGECRAVCNSENQTCETLKLTRKDLVAYELDFLALVTWVRAGLKLKGEGPRAEESLARTFLVGDLRFERGRARPRLLHAPVVRGEGPRHRRAAARAAAWGVRPRGAPGLPGAR